MLVTIRLAAAAVLLAVFVASAIDKLGSPRFVANDANYRILPIPLVQPTAKAIPIIELAISAAMLMWLNSALPVLAAAALLLLFAGAMTVNLLRGREIACGCRGGGKLISWPLATANVSLAAIAGGSALVHPRITDLGVANSLRTLELTVLVWLGVRILGQIRAIRTKAGRFDLLSRQESP